MAYHRPTVRAEWKMECPRCHSDEQLEIQVTMWVRLTGDGTGSDMSEDGAHVWDDNSPIVCHACNRWEGIVSAARISELAPDLCSICRSRHGNEIIHACE
jgi:hypothetical protein